MGAMDVFAGVKDKIAGGFQGLMSKLPTPSGMIQKAYEWLCKLPIVGSGIEHLGQKIGLEPPEGQAQAEASEAAPAAAQAEASEAASAAAESSQLTTTEPVGPEADQADGAPGVDAAGNEGAQVTQPDGDGFSPEEARAQAQAHAQAQSPAPEQLVPEAAPEEQQDASEHQMEMS